MMLLLVTMIMRDKLLDDYNDFGDDDNEDDDDVNELPEDGSTNDISCVSSVG